MFKFNYFSISEVIKIFLNSDILKFGLQNIYISYGYYRDWLYRLSVYLKLHIHKTKYNIYSGKVENSEIYETNLEAEFLKNLE